MMLSELIEQYITFRKSLGELQQTNANYLRSFGRCIGTNTDIADVRPQQVDTFLAGKGPITSTWHIKLSVLRPFYRYAVSRGYVPTAPLPTVIPKRPPAFVPYIFSHEDLRRLLQAVDTDPSRSRCMAPRTIRTMLLVMYGAGLRIREAVDLNRGDVDLKASVLTVRQTKFGKTRLVPVGPQLSVVLAKYAARMRHASPDTPFFATRSGGRIKPDTLQHNYRILCGQAGVSRADGARYQPRIHDLRHSFAVHRLISWYRQGADVQRLLPHLSTYMGHVHIRHTQHYLSMTPELLQEAGQRFEHYAIKEAGHD